MIIKDKLINDYIQDKAIELHQKLITEIDGYLQRCHEVKIGKRGAFEVDVLTEDINFTYDKLIVLRKTINTSINGFTKIDIDDIVNCAPLESRLRHNLREILGLEGLMRETFI